jgi:N-sulfoglucosamine sulfohydrolase
LHVPLIVRIPKKFQTLSPHKPGTAMDRLVSFIDFAPTVLSLAGIAVPDHMQGKAFLGKQIQPPHEYIYSFRGRMDERIDMSRSASDKKFRYIRNYLPHLIYGQHLEYLWKSPSMNSWEKEFKEGKLNEIQSRFWRTKPVEELYDVEADPDNINNLADQPQYQKVLSRMRQANHDWIIRSKDLGFIPEAILYRLSLAPSTLYEELGDSKNLQTIIETAEMSSSRDPKHLKEIIGRLNHQDPSVRYWASVGCIVLKEPSAGAKDILKKLLSDSEIAVRIAAAQALYFLGEKDDAIEALKLALTNENSFARLQALNALQTFGKDASPALTLAKRLILENPKDNDYDSRAAQTLVETFEK